MTGGVSPKDWEPSPPIELEGNALAAVKATTTLAVAAGPGTGKTEMLSQRASFLLQTGLCPAPKRILALAFKTDAAKNLSDRVALRCSAESVERFDSYTFHAFAKQILDRFRLALPAKQRPKADYEVGSGKLPDFVGFPKMLELAHEILKSKTSILKAFQITYSHIFLDEFQDCTLAQYELLRTLLSETEIVVTAVGDPNQSIMKWANALPTAFQTFVKDYGLDDPLELLINRRSEPYLQEVQRSILHHKSSSEEFLVKDAEGGRVAFHQFDSSQQEADFLLDFARAHIATSDPSELCFLARKKDAASELVERFRADGVQFRDERDDLQDILSEPISDCILAWMRLCIGDNLGANKRLNDFVNNILGFLDEDTTYGRSIDRQLEAGLRKYREGCDPRASTRATFREGLKWLLKDLIGVPQIRSTWPQYAQGSWFSKVIEKLSAVLDDARTLATDWQEALDLVEGVGAVRVMTIHKSKGLEFESVVVIGLEDQVFDVSDLEEEWCCFYVAASRAKQKMLFTTADTRSGKSNTFRKVNGFHNSLQAARVETYRNGETLH